MTIGQRLIRARERAGFASQSKGAAQCRLASSTLSDYENDQRIPGGLALQQICRRYRCSADEILGLRAGSR